MASQPMSVDEPPPYSSIVRPLMNEHSQSRSSSVPKRRPLPQQPSTDVGIVVAMHDFTSQSSEELGFVQGDIIEVLDDTPLDGWWRARLRGQTDLIPSTYVRDMYGKVSKQPDSPPRVSDSFADAADLQYADRLTYPSSSHISRSQMEPSNRNKLPNQSPPQTDPTSWNYNNCTVTHASTYATLEGHNKVVKSVAFCPCSNLLASTSEDNTIILWDSATGKAKQILNGHSKGVTTSCFTPDGKMLISGSYDEFVMFWDVRTGSTVQSLRHPAPVHNVAISPDGRTFAASLHDATVKIWDLQSRMLLNTLNGHKDMIGSVKFSPDSTYLVSGSHDKTVRTWDYRSRKQLQKIKAHSGLMNYIMSVAVSPDSKVLASASLDRSVKLWDAESGSAIRKLALGELVNDVLFSPDGKTIIAGTASGEIIILTTEGLQLARIKGHGDQIEGLALSTDQRLMATASADKTVKLWRVE